MSLQKSMSRRGWLASTAAQAVAIGASRCNWAHALNQQLPTSSRKRLILLWMAGGPSQIDSFDMKPGHANGGSFREIETAVPGIRICEHLPKLAKWTQQMAIVRSLQTKEGDHGRGTYLVRTGQRPGSPVRYPPLPASLAKAIAEQPATNPPSEKIATGQLSVPDYVAIQPPSAIEPTAFGSGFLGPKHQPLLVTGSASNGVPGMNSQASRLRVENLLPPERLSGDRLTRRKELWNLLQQSYDVHRRSPASLAHDTVARRAMSLSESPWRTAFDLDLEEASVRAAYGEGTFGQGCLMARRLLEQGVPVVEVAMGSEGLGWDTHAQNFEMLPRLLGELDTAWSQLMTDLEQRGLLQDTTILWIGEFGRTPIINPAAGRDHFPDAWSCVLAGGNIAGGQVFGKTSDDGQQVVEDPVTIGQVLATVAASCGIDPKLENVSEEGRPIAIAEGQPIERLLA